MNVLPGWFPATMLQSKPLLLYQASLGSAADLTIYTFSSVAIGPADGKRAVIVGVCTRDLSSTADIGVTVTVGGITATEVITAVSTADSGRNEAALYLAIVPSGTSADVVITYNRATDRCGIAVWSAYNLNSIVATDTATSTGLSSQTLDVDVQADGFAIGYSYANNTPAWTWTGLTERFETVVEVALLESGADITLPAAATPRTITATLTNSPSLALAVAASFR